VGGMFKIVFSLFLLQFEEISNARTNKADELKENDKQKQFS